MEEEKRKELLGILPQLQSHRSHPAPHHLKGVKPLHQPVYRVSECLLLVFTREPEVIRELGVIEPSSSEWRSLRKMEL